MESTVQEQAQTKELNWGEEAAALSAYHFDKNRIDPRFDAVIGLGRFSGDWADEVADAVAKATPVSMAIRGNRNQTEYSDSEDRPGYSKTSNLNGKYDYEKDYFRSVGFDYDNYPVVHKTKDFGPKMRKMIDAFCFADPQWHTVHVQQPGSVFPWHIDIFHRRKAMGVQDQSKILRVVIHLNDWEPGHFYGYGNYQHWGWKAGDFHTFSHADTPHYTANASLTPRVVMLLTGMKTEATEEFLFKARTTPTIEI
jgi:hypothetical protein